MRDCWVGYWDNWGVIGLGGHQAGFDPKRVVRNFHRVEKSLFWANFGSSVCVGGGGREVHFHFGGGFGGFFSSDGDGRDVAAPGLAGSLLW